MGLSTNGHAKPSSLRLLEELPGIGDVVWAAVTKLESSHVPTTVLFTAAESRAGTSVLSAATAIGLAQHQRVPVCLVETNVRRPALAGYLGLAAVPGLSDVLDGRAELEECLHEPPDCPGLVVLSAGTPRAPVPGEFTTDRMNAVLAQLEGRGHYVVLDTASVLDHVESRLLLRRADAVLLVLRARATRRLDAERAHRILLESGTPVLGSIFNDYRTESLFGGSSVANRSFERAVRAERVRPSLAPAALRGGIEAAWNGQPPIVREGLPAAIRETALPSNGDHFEEAHVPLAGATEESYRRQIDVLERRIAKLTLQLEQTESDLRRIAAMKNIDLGLASIYRSVQGLSAEDEARQVKRSLLKKIFQANLELKTAIAQIP